MNCSKTINPKRSGTTGLFLLTRAQRCNSDVNAPYAFTTAGALRAKALAEQAVRRCSPQVKARQGCCRQGAGETGWLSQYSSDRSVTAHRISSGIFAPLRFCVSLIRMRGHLDTTAGALRAKALAEDAVRRCSPHVEAPLELLMPLRGLCPRYAYRGALTGASCPTNARTSRLTDRKPVSVLGARCSVLSSQFSVLSSRCSVLSFRFSYPLTPSTTSTGAPATPGNRTSTRR
ncbi:MAG: hypothetical protein KatS3mg058_0691 [Roseiflexus sp.]|nr:MAG: hypothetical protein KatS3mg058_0691 [Roseiflexus sp.]